MGVIGIICLFLVVPLERYLKAPHPRLMLGAESLTILSPRTADLAWVDNKMTEVKAAYPEARPAQLEVGPIQDFRKALGVLGASIASGSVPPPEEYKRYNRDRLQYFKDLREALIAQEELSAARASRAIEIELILSNRRNQAEGLEVEMHFPDPLKVFSVETFPTTIDLPDPPEPPKPLSSGLFPNLADFNMTKNLRMPDIGPPPNVGPFDIDELHSVRVRVPVEKLGVMPLSCGCLVVFYPSYEAAGKVKVPYTITGQNIAKVKKGKLVLKPTKIIPHISLPHKNQQSK